MRTIIFAFLLLLLTPVFSVSQVYRWIDEQGNVHFTDDITQIPGKYRSKSEKRQVDETTVIEKERTDVRSSKKEAGEKDRLGRGEEYWRGRIEEARTKLRTLEEKADDLRVKYNELTEKINSSRSSVERSNLRKQRDEIKVEIDQIRASINETKDLIEKKLPEEAELYKAKPEWVKK